MGSKCGPGVLLRVRKRSCIVSEALTSKRGVARSKALRGTMLIDPARAVPGISGVGVCDTSMRATLLTENCESSTARRVLMRALARSKPPTVIGTESGGTPSSEISPGSPPM